jgi:hypothetical protein
VVAIVFNANVHGTMVTGPGVAGPRSEEGPNVATEGKMPGTEVKKTRGGAAPGVDMKGHMHVSELVSDRAAAPSPFGDDQTFPLPVESLRYHESHGQ